MLDTALQAEIRAQIEREREACWEAELTKKHPNPLLDSTRELPAPDHCPWENLRSSTLAPVPPTGKEMAAYLERNELGDAELFQLLHGEEFCFNHARKKWLQFGEVVWEEDILQCSAKAAMNLAEHYDAAGVSAYAYYDAQRADVAVELEPLYRKLATVEAAKADTEPEDYKAQKKKLQAEIDDTEAEAKRLLGKARAAKKSYDERARVLRSVKRRDNVLKAAISGEGSCGKSGEEFDQHPALLAVANGVVDLETGRMVRNSPSLYLTRVSRHPYHGLHVSNAWFEDHLQKITCQNEELLRYFELCIGHSVTGYQWNKDIYVALGPLADNGKSLTFNAIREAAGTVADTIKLDVLLEEKYRSKGPDPDVMVLDGLRMGLASEATESVTFSTERIKAITGSDPLRARGMYADSKVIDSRVKLWLHTNEMPKFGGYDPGFMKRLKIIPFLAQFVPPAEADPAAHKYPMLERRRLEALLQESYPAIVSWLVRCARAFLLHPTLEVPPIVLTTTSQYFEDQDIIGAFLEQCCIFEPGAVAGSQELWKAFACWSVKVMGARKDKIMSNIRLSRDIRKRPRISVKQTRPTTIFGGLRLNDEWDGKELE